MKERIALALYGALLRLLTPFYLLRLWRRGRAEPLYRQFIGERLGVYKQAAPAHGWIWIHAVSLGETRAAAALVERLRALRPGSRILLTHSTATGREAGRELLREGDAQAWLPYDRGDAVRRFLLHWQPAVGVLMETEIWPNLQAEAARFRLPMVLANARLSEKSLRQGRRFAALLQPAARRLTLALAQSEPDAERIRAMGTPRVEVMGNLKYDMQPDSALIERGRAWRERLGRPVLLAAVFREGEEQMLLDAWKKLRVYGQRPLLVIVPRHPQRFDEVAALVQAAGLTLARRSTWQDLPPDEALAADCWLGDSMREMPLYYGLADAALLGGSYAKLGGQNLIEAAACGCPMVMGPHTFNFAEASTLAESAGAALRAADIEQALTQALRLCEAPSEQQAMARRAMAFAAQHRGAAERMAQAISAILP
ncbi:3-deoxy-D-manno-octulosonic acid transferase [Paucibacter sp. R3-3]|uniref:3-deoxy-D-manno-octulosonic acid transferase n=1 Tax=Roseateles agri TaxID=3098619 RepID=A0ABU5DIQ4_9BURK|nr:3-deoxy-D-manno-octulosonic acid transferase [Paucibacter sp. R3-3]MDY0745605.1 3-deoxy-D-manno-octulosonic acid transferase [Paucibacter sp. R3-3]